MIGLTKNLKAQIESLERENNMRIKWNIELEMRLQIAYLALEGIAKETGTPYGREAQDAIDKIHTYPRGEPGK